MINFACVAKETTKKKNCPNWQQTPDHSRKLILIGSSGTEKTNALLNLINQELYTDQIYLYAK